MLPKPEAVDSELNLARFWLHGRGQDVLWLQERGCWLLWKDGAGWIPNSDENCVGEVQRLGSAHWVRIGRGGNLVPAPTVGGKYSTASGSLKSARPYVLTSVSEWDKDPEIVGVAGGKIVNLRSGEVRTMTREDRVSLHVPVEPDFNVPDDCRWRKFLRETFNDPMVLEYVMRLAGYTLTGYARERTIPFLYGKKRLGKSVYYNAIREAMGGYAEVSIASNYQRGNRIHRTFYAKLKDARGVFLTEIPRGFQLDEGLVKSITGGEPLESNYMNNNPFTFQPQFSIWMIGNNAPTMSERDGALLDRIKVIEFHNKPKELDPTLPSILKGEEQPFVLADMIMQAAEYLSSGIGRSPDEVVAAGEEYAERADTLSAFLAECVEPAPWDEYIANLDLFRAYRAWVEEARQPKPYGRTGFLRALREGDYKVGGQEFRGTRQRDGKDGFAGAMLRTEWAYQPAPR